MSEPPEFVKGDNFEVTDELRALGVELSKSLPTYDVPIDLIYPCERNPNEMDDATFNRLVQELEETGFVDPIQIVPAKGGKFRIVGGEHRWLGARTLGWEKIPCNILTDERFMDEDLQELVMVRLNVIKGKLNPDKFTALYEDKAKKYGVEQLQALFGYTSTDAWNKITKGVEQAIQQSVPGGSGLVQELRKRTQKVRSVDGLGRVLNTLFKEYGSDLKHSFMVFAHGGKKHVYILLTDEARAELDTVLVWCRKNNKDINDVLTPLLLDFAASLREGDA